VAHPFDEPAKRADDGRRDRRTAAVLSQWLSGVEIKRDPKATAAGEPAVNLTSAQLTCTLRKRFICIKEPKGRL
jgi:hypothetical protein